MKSKIKLIVFVLLIAFISSYAFIKFKKSRDEDPYKMFGIFAKVYDIVIQRYVEPVDQNKLILGAYRGGVQSLNEDNSFITKDIMEKIKDRFNYKGNIGIKVTKRGNYAQVVYSNPESDAFKAGIKPGTIIRKINSMQAFNMSLYEINAMLHGKVGDKIAIDFYSTDLSKDIEKQFEYKEYKPVDFKIDTIKNAKVFKLFRFTKECFENMKNYIKENDTPIIDIRYSMDDNYEEMVNFASYLKGEPLSVLAKTKEKEEEIKSTIQEKFDGKKTLFLATSSLTMGAADVFANLLKGTPYIKTVGGRTSGSAYKYQTFKLKSGDYVNIAVKMFKPLTKKGLLPDIRSFIDDDEIIDAVRRYKKEEKKDNGDEKKAA
ncbi:S41 family peptidase [Thermotomaculum hydrothermale]|nr:S41 family peptidase [Thermotomaculum hydrothermale]